MAGTGSLKRQTRASVRAADRFAALVMRVGGFAVLAAVLGVCVYLAVAALPLFAGGRLLERPTVAFAGGEPVQLHADEYGRLGAFVARDGTVEVVSLADGKVLQRVRLGPDDARVTALSHPEAGRAGAAGFDDGRVALWRLGFESAFVTPEGLPDASKSLLVGQSHALPAGEGAFAGVMERVSPDQFRATRLSLEVDDPVTLDDSRDAIRLVDVREMPSGERYVVALRDGGRGVFASARTVRPLGGGKPKTRVQSRAIALGEDLADPDWMFVTGDGASVLALWATGEVVRLASRDGLVEPVERARAVPPGRSATSAAMLLGGQTLLVGDDAGTLRGLAPGRDPSPEAPADGLRLVETLAHAVGEPSPVCAIACSPRTRLVAAGCASGDMVLRHATSGKVLARARTRGVPRALAFLPKGDALAGVTGEGEPSLESWGVESGHIEASVGSLLGRRVYEGETTAQWVYQSSAADDAAEVKLSLVPLIFGTIKATLVAMLIAIPLAVLAAVFTSEFLRPRVRGVIKPTIELMASLPSVVLGFLAAMIVAPVVASWLASVMLGLVLLPVLVMLGAHAWQMAPARWGARLGSGGRLVLVGLVLLLGVGACAILGPVVERAMFVPTRADRLVRVGSFVELAREDWPTGASRPEVMGLGEQRRLRARGVYVLEGRFVRAREGDGAPPGEPGSLRGWLDGSFGRAQPGWVLLLSFPAVAAWWIVSVREQARRRGRGLRAGQSAPRELLRFAGVVVLGVASAWGLGWALDWMGLDARDSVLGPFSQRNTLVVGIIMGFAVVPIIYTIAEDALRSVPEQLRSASLGVGATPWQTALRVVLPAASSGVFSACMIGLGRAVGETMIVLMATGNTPEMTPNIFSGLRTLAANIAVELPEAPAGSTHYRVLVLCGLVLFLMTFIINTTAEVVRQRVRRRNAAL